MMVPLQTDFRVGRHCHPMHESNQVLQCEAAILRKYYPEVGHCDNEIMF